MPRLVPAAAVGIVIVMISATIWHLMRAESGNFGERRLAPRRRFL